MKKEALSFCLAVSALLALCACGEKKEAPAPGNESNNQVAEPTAATEPAPSAETPASQETASEVSAELQELVSAAAAGDAVAQNNLAMAYAAGEGGLKADAAKAAELYRASAEQGNATARFNLARCYALGEGVDADAAAFVEHCTKAAYAGCAAAQYALGCAYRDGLGVKQDLIEAERWLSRAEMNGYAPAKAAWKELKAR